MKSLLNSLSNLSSFSETEIIIYLDALNEFSQWGTDKPEEKIALLNKSISLGKKASELYPKNYYIYFLTGTALGSIALYKGFPENLILVSDIDKYLLKTIELKPDFYLVYFAIAMKLRELPQFFGGDEKKSEEYFLKSIMLEPGFIKGYYELAILYKKQNNKPKAIFYLNQVINLPLQKGYHAQSEEIKNLAVKALKEFK